MFPFGKNQKKLGEHLVHRREDVAPADRGRSLPRLLTDQPTRQRAGGRHKKVTVAPPQPHPTPPNPNVPENWREGLRLKAKLVNGH